MNTNSGMTPDQLAAAGCVLYGERWQTSLATDLHVADRTMRRWLAGETSIPDGLRNELRELLINRVNEIGGVIQYSFNQSARSEYFSSKTLKELQDRRRSGARGRSQPPGRERARHQFPDAIPVKRNDEKQIHFARQVMNRADCRDEHARCVAIGHFQHR